MVSKKVKAMLLMCTLTSVISLSTVGCSTAKDADTKPTVSSEVSTEDTTEDTETESKENEKEKDVVLSVGDTWTVDGQWNLTINSVEATEERNEYAEEEPDAVYVVNYTYENLGYEDKSGMWDGLYIDLSASQIVDSAGKMGYSYPGDMSKFPVEAPVGATCEAEAVIGVDSAGDFKLTCIQYDSNEVKQKATFNLTVDSKEETKEAK